jgi:hypothetical protein
MAERQPHNTPKRVARVTAALCAAVIAALTLLWLGAYLLHSEKPIVGTPGPRALFHATFFTLRPGQSACMSQVTLPPKGRAVQLELGEVGTNGSPPLEVLLTAPAYRESARLPAGQSEGPAQLAMRPPRHYVVGSACVINRGSIPAQLAGSTEQRSRSRVKLTIGGRPVAGNFSLTFSQTHNKTRLGRLSEVLEHASNLTDRLIPLWLVWIVFVLVLLTLPVAIVASLYRALRADEASSS